MIQWLTKDWGLKLISLILAVGLWYYAVGEESVEVTRVVPLSIQLKNEKISILKTSAKNVQITLAAPRGLISDLASEEILAVHEIGGDVKTAGEYTFRLEPRDIKITTPQIRVTAIKPEVVHVTIDELIVQKLKIEPNLVGEPAFGYKVMVDQIEVDPNALLVEGPKGELEKMAALKTENIDLVGRIRSFRRTVELDIPSNMKPMSDALVDLYVPIQEESGEKLFENIPVKILELPEEDAKIELDPQNISFTLKGPQKQLESLEPSKIFVYVDLSSLSSGQHEVPVSMLLPDTVSRKDDAPLLVRVKIKK